MSKLETQTYSYWAASRAMAGMPVPDGQVSFRASETLWQVARFAVSQRLRNISIRTLVMHRQTIELRPGPGGGMAA